MLTRKHNTFVKVVLFCYVLVSVTFHLAHTDFLAIQGEDVFTSSGDQSHALDSDKDGDGCPAHQYEQATTGTPVSTFRIVSPTIISFLIPLRQAQHSIAFRGSASSRAPPHT